MTHSRFQLRAEWEAQSGVMLAWPHSSTDWSFCLETIWQTYVDLATAIAQTAKVLILCQDPLHQDQIVCSLPPSVLPRCRFAHVPYNDTWCRDYGPLTLARHQETRLIDFIFNGWGDKYDAQLDNMVNQQLKDLGLLPTDMHSVDLELEGGSIETDGQGTLLTTEQCLLNANRNSRLSRQVLETRLKSCLGVDRILWISEGYLAGDDTDSHIDNLVRFVSADTLVHVLCQDKDDPHYMPLLNMKRQLEQLTTPQDTPYKLVPLPLPRAQHEPGTRSRLPASYANFLILNDIVIVPVFQCSEDEHALRTLAELFPNKTLSPIDGRQLIRQYGGPHCATMQLPPGIL